MGSASWVCSQPTGGEAGGEIRNCFCSGGGWRCGSLFSPSSSLGYKQRRINCITTKLSILYIHVHVYKLQIYPCNYRNTENTHVHVIIEIPLKLQCLCNTKIPKFNHNHVNNLCNSKNTDVIKDIKFPNNYRNT